MSKKPENVAKRATYQYRGRDILAYASLRLYLKNQCALRDKWVHEIASELVLNQTQPSYNHVLYFKQMDKEGGCEFRDLYVPGPNEILAETALLGECAKHSEVFQPASSVYSYRLSSGNETKGVYKYYFYGFHERHRAIAEACRERSDTLVLYNDIKRFYPSISIDRARNVWNSACDDANLSNRNREIGLRLLENYERTTVESGSGLPIGPMFSHLIGNLVLREVDLRMEEIAPGRYFRYVDDFVFVATEEKAEELEENLRLMLTEKELELHPEKRDPVPAARWLCAANVFESDISPVSWKTFIGKLKQLMLFKPDLRNEMECKFIDAEIRVRPTDYSDVRQDNDFLNRMRTLFESGWFRLKMFHLSPDRVLDEGLQLRSRYMKMFFDTLEYMDGSDSIGRKMSTSRLRYLLSRLAYLATPEQLLTISSSIDGIEEVAIFATVLRALASRDVSDLLKFGSVAAQSVASSLKMDSRPVRCSVSSNTEAASQAYAILLLYGVPLEVSGEPFESEMVTFCQGGRGVSELFESSDTYFRELACLHGLDEPEVLRWSLETAFDRDEEMASEMTGILDMSYLV